MSTASTPSASKSRDLVSILHTLVRGIPIPIAGLALGVVALGNLLQPYGEPVHTACGVIGLLLVLALLAKIALFPGVIAADMHNPIFGSVSATLFMALMQLATYLAPLCHPAALALWWVAVVGHACVIVWFTVLALALGHFRLADVYPTYFICYVGIVVGSVTSPSVGMQAVGRALFVFGFVCYVVTFVLVSARYVRHPAPEPARPLFCIYAAPMSLSLAGYLSTHAAPNLALAIALEVLAQLLLLLVLLRLPSLLSLPFYPSYAAMTFPFVICAVALSKTLAALRASGIAVPGALDVLLAAETILATGMVAYVLVRYLMFLVATARTAAQSQPVAGAVARR